MPAGVSVLPPQASVLNDKLSAVIQQSGALRFGPLSQAFDSERKVLVASPHRIDSASTGRARYSTQPGQSGAPPGWIEQSR